MPQGSDTMFYPCVPWRGACLGCSCPMLTIPGRGGFPPRFPPPKPVACCCIIRRVKITVVGSVIFCLIKLPPIQKRMMMRPSWLSDPVWNPTASETPPSSVHVGATSRSMYVPRLPPGKTWQCRLTRQSLGSDE